MLTLLTLLVSGNLIQTQDEIKIFKYLVVGAGSAGSPVAAKLAQGG